MDTVIETSIVVRRVGDAMDRHLQIRMKSGAEVYLCPEDLCKVIRYACYQRLITLDQLGIDRPNR